MIENFDNFLVTYIVFTLVPMNGIAAASLIGHMSRIYDPEKNREAIETMMPALALFSDLVFRGSIKNQTKINELIVKLVMCRTAEDYRSWIRKDLVEALEAGGHLAPYLKIER